MTALGKKLHSSDQVRQGSPTVPIFIGMDQRERAATNVLIDSLVAHSSVPLAITPLVSSQLEHQGLYWRSRDPLQSTDFSFSRFLVPQLLNFQGWGLFLDCDMLCRADIAELWALRDDRFALMCVQHEHVPKETEKFLGEPQSAYPRKNWSSVMLFNAGRCRALSPAFVNSASGLELHRFLWLSNDADIGPLPHQWNHLVGVQEPDASAKLLHWTLGGPWFRGQRQQGGALAAEWFGARDDAMALWNP